MTRISLVEAIARKEGWLVPSSRCRRNHNPGNIEYGPFARKHGATGTDGRFAKFPDDATGFAALKALLSGPSYAHLTLAQCVARYAPPSENDTARYVKLVSDWTGYPANATVSSMMSSGDAVNSNKA